MKPWEPLQHDQVVLIYSTMLLGKIETKEWKYKKPASTVNSTVIVHTKEGLHHDIENAHLVILHIQQDISMDLNHGLIEIITHNFRLQPRNGMLHLVLKAGQGDPNLPLALDSLGRFALPVKFPVSKGEKLTRAGFIPLLPNYRYDKSLMSADLYMLLVKRIVAIVIQKHFGIIHRDNPLDEAAILAYGLKQHLQAFFPGWVVQVILTSEQCDVFSFDKDDPTISSIFLYSEPLSSEFLGIVLTFESDLDPLMTINHFLRLRPFVYPNPVLLKRRHFSGISSTIYNNATSFKTNLIDFKPIIHQYLTTYTMLYTTSSSLKSIVNMLPEYKSVVMGSTSFSLKEGTILIVLPGVLYEAHTTIAYDSNLLYSVHVPFVLFELTGKEKVKSKTTHDKTFKVITARHVDEPALAGTDLVIAKTFSEY